jgi:hypothetical protein
MIRILEGPISFRSSGFHFTRKHLGLSSLFVEFGACLRFDGVYDLPVPENGDHTPALGDHNPD